MIGLVMLRKKIAVMTYGNQWDESWAVHCRSVLTSSHRCCHCLTFHSHSILATWPMTIPRNLSSQNNNIWTYSLTEILSHRVSFEFHCLVAFTCVFLGLIHICSCYFLFFLIIILVSIQSTGLHYNIFYHSLAAPFHPPSNRLPSDLLAYRSLTSHHSLPSRCPAVFNDTISMCSSLSYLHCCFYYCWIYSWGHY